ncbi:hypothetical protein FACS189485_06560 [Spirochaetia bacterium]|nr:hypothetical protein FACS189485_06560 [Spirochaetia bacterium]
MMTEEEFSVIENIVKQIFKKYRVSNHSDCDKVMLEDEIKATFNEKSLFCPVVEFNEDGLDEIISLKDGNEAFFEVKGLLVPFSYRIKTSY